MRISQDTIVTSNNIDTLLFQLLVHNTCAWVSYSLVFWFLSEYSRIIPAVVIWPLSAYSRIPMLLWANIGQLQITNLELSWDITTNHIILEYFDMVAMVQIANLGLLFSHCNILGYFLGLLLCWFRSHLLLRAIFHQMAIFIT